MRILLLIVLFAIVATALAQRGPGGRGRRRGPVGFGGRGVGGFRGRRFERPGGNRFGIREKRLILGRPQWGVPKWGGPLFGGPWGRRPWGGRPWGPGRRPGCGCGRNATTTVAPVTGQTTTVAAETTTVAAETTTVPVVTTTLAAATTTVAPPTTTVPVETTTLP